MKIFNKRRLYLTIFGFAVLTQLVLYTNCSQKKFTENKNLKSEETITGNPKPQAVVVNLVGIQDAAVSQLTMCLQEFKLISANSAVPTVTIPLSAGSVQIGRDMVMLVQGLIPTSQYSRAELILRRAPSCANSMSFRNENGVFNSVNELPITFSGSVNITESTLALNLDIQQLYSQLNAVSANQELEPIVANFPGQVIEVERPQIRQYQTGSLSNQSNSLSTADFSSTISRGNLIICAVAYESAVTQISSVSDSASNNYNRADIRRGAGQLSNWTLETWASANSNSLPNLNVTANFNGSFSGEKNIVCAEYSGIYPNNPIQNNTVGGYGYGSDVSTVPISTYQLNEILFVAALIPDVAVAVLPPARRQVSFRNIVIADDFIQEMGNFSVSFSHGPLDWAYNVMLIRGYVY